MDNIFHLPTPLNEIITPETLKHNVKLWLKRDDLIHPEISGNKWRKLKYNLLEAQRQNKNTVLTFGGAYSNHITATAAAGKYLGFKTIGIIRGEEHQPLNASLQFAQNCGMQLEYVNRTTFAQIRNSTIKFPTSLLRTQNTEDIYIIPEGGANALAIKGCNEIVSEINIDFDYACCACGTGTTITGIATQLQPHQKAIGMAVLKHEAMEMEIKSNHTTLQNSLIIDAAHYGGYAKTTPALLAFIANFQKEQNILLDYVYTGKMLYHLINKIADGYFAPGTVMVAVHTGGVMNAAVL